MPLAMHVARGDLVGRNQADAENDEQEHRNQQIDARNKAERDKPQSIVGQCPVKYRQKEKAFERAGGQNAPEALQVGMPDDAFVGAETEKADQRGGDGEQVDGQDAARRQENTQQAFRRKYAQHRGQK